MTAKDVSPTFTLNWVIRLIDSGEKRGTPLASEETALITGCFGKGKHLFLSAAGLVGCQFLKPSAISVVVRNWGIWLLPWFWVCKAVSLSSSDPGNPEQEQICRKLFLFHWCCSMAKHLSDWSLT